MGKKRKHNFFHDCIKDLKYKTKILLIIAAIIVLVQALVFPTAVDVFVLALILLALVSLSIK